MPTQKTNVAVELFAGAGGLAMGIAEAGFRHLAVIENNPWACATLARNTDWPLFQTDVREFDYESISQSIDLLAGGPPCQPFSVGGKHQSHLDLRDMFPEAIRAVRVLKPRVFLFENVRGMLRKSFSHYFEYIVLQLRHPDVVQRQEEEWLSHFARLQQHETSGSKTGLHYNVVWQVLNAADYGVAQKRERLFIVGFRGDIGIKWAFPSATHSLDALLWGQYVSGEYWSSHGLKRRPRQQHSAVTLKPTEIPNQRPHLQPWRTVRDALHGLPDPEFHPKEARRYSGHLFVPGARTYPSHTGSPHDLPAKTLKAGVHGVPGGENMLLRPSGMVRYFTVRECARLQDFPDNFVFEGTWTTTIKQFGNAVPVGLARPLARSISVALQEAHNRNNHFQ